MNKDNNERLSNQSFFHAAFRLCAEDGSYRTGEINHSHTGDDKNRYGSFRYVDKRQKIDGETKENK